MNGWRTLLVEAIVVVGIIVVGAFAYETRKALCTFRGDLGSRIVDAQSKVDESRAYLDAHPGPVLGFPHSTAVASLVQQQGVIDGQRRTYSSLAGLHC